MRRRSFFTSSLATLGAACLGRPATVAADDAHQTLRGAGLKRHGDLWLLPDERQVRDQLADLPQLRDSILVLEREVQERVRQNRQAFQASKPIVASLQQSLSRLNSSDPDRKALERQLAAERGRATPPDKLGGQAEVRSMVVRLSQQRTDLTLRLLSLRRRIPELIEQYARLTESQDVAAALDQLGRGQRLGPARPLEPELRKLSEVDPLVFTSYLPIWLQSGHIRFTGIVSEKQPLTFTWNEYPGHGLVLTTSAAQALDVTPKAGAEKRSLTFSKGRKVTAQRTTLTSLRLARWVAPDVPAWILNSEGEDLGSQLDASALDRYEASCELAALRLTLQSRR